MHQQAPTKIVVVEDDPDIRTLLTTLLPRRGYAAVLWQLGSDPVDLIACEQPAIVILDVRIRSHEDGWAVLDRLRSNPTTQHIPVLVCSADILTLRQRQAELAARGCTILTKPFAFTDLFTVLAAIQPA